MKLQEAIDLLTVPQAKHLRTLIRSDDRATRKSDIAAVVAGYLLTGDLGDLWRQLSALEIQAIAESVHSWGGAFDAVRFRARYGALPAHFQPVRYFAGLGERAPERPDLLPLFFYQGEIPEDLRPRLAALAPRPAELPFATLSEAELPKTVRTDRGTAAEADAEEPLRRVSTEPLVHQDLPAVLRLIGQGGVAVGPKTGLPGSAAIARIESVLQGGDWYAPQDDLGTERWAGGPIRPIRPFAWPVLLQSAGLAKLDGTRLALTARGSKALSQPIGETVAQLFERWQVKGAPDELRRVDNVKGQTGKGARLTAVTERRQTIAAALRECPPGSWIAVDELFRQMQFRGHRFEVSNNPWALYVGNPQYGSLGGGFKILPARYCLVYLFEYLATLGMIDIAYTLPYQARPDYGDLWGTDEMLLLSRYDGLRYVRVNPLGAYCLGLAPHYRPTLEEAPPLLAIESDLGLALLREPQPAERLLLERIARPLSPTLWGLDPDALLQHSADPYERGRLRDFLESAVDGALPPALRQLLDSVSDRATALTDSGPARLIKCREVAIATLLAADPATAPHCIRAGDRSLCVPESKLAAFRKGLARLGFVLPETERG